MTSLTASIRVLLVEDNSADLALVQSCLKDYGHPHIDMLPVTRLSDALAALGRQTFHVIIVDLNLPDTEGLQTFFKLKEASPDSAFVVMTGVDDRDTCLQAVRSGAQDYLVKGDSGPRQIWQSVRNAIVRQAFLDKISHSAKELTDVNTRLQELTRVDPLTGLYNRRGFDDRLAQEAARPQFDATVNSVLLVDVDNFKQVNDVRGHDQGDLALQEVSRHLRASVRPRDIVARVGGDEFMVLLPETNMILAAEIAERIRRAVEEHPVPSAEGNFPLTVSVGVARQTIQENTAHALLACTHLALAVSKQNGKNRISYSGADPLPSSLGDAEVRVLKRPFFHMADGKTTGYEFLCRSWPAAERPPTLPSTENAASLSPILQAFRHCLLASAQLPAGLECHVRLHCSDLTGLKPVDLLKLLPKGFDPARLSLELRDLSHTPLSPAVLPLLRALLGEGVRPVLHDNDLMQHTMAVLLQLEPVWVKLGRGRFSGIAEDPFKEGKLRHLLKVVEGLGARAIACGVENGQDLDILLQLNVFHGQGPLWIRH